MKWTVLSDNRTCNDLLQTEHGLSILLETDKYRILLDTGASDVFIRNAEKIGIDLSTVDYVFISHGHNDHAGGLKHLMNINDKAKVIVSPNAINRKFFSKRGNLHSITAEWPMIDDDRLVLTDQTCAIAENIHVIAHIPQNHPMPKGNQHLYVQNNAGDYIHDDFRHEFVLYVMVCCLQAVPIAVLRISWQLVRGRFIPLSEVSTYSTVKRQKMNWRLWLIDSKSITLRHIFIPVIVRVTKSSPRSKQSWAINFMPLAVA